MVGHGIRAKRNEMLHDQVEMGKAVKEVILQYPSIGPRF